MKAQLLLSLGVAAVATATVVYTAYSKYVDPMLRPPSRK
jgi:hypothetical protein